MRGAVHAATLATASGNAPSTPPMTPAQPGDVILTTFRGRTAPADLLRRARLGRIAGVMLVRDNIHTTAQVRALTRSLQAAARSGGQPPLIIAVDQEGGTVRRFASAPPAASARDMGGLATAQIRARAVATARALRAAGVNVDFAPVTDVPDTPRNFLGSRAFARTAAEVTRGACAFASGLDAGGVRPTLKHFPGLGGAGRINTDDGVVAIRRTAAARQRDLAAYRACAGDPSTLVMVSNASYPGLTGPTPAVFARATYQLARDIGVAGPIVTDSLSAKALAGQTDVAPRAVRAGADLLLYTSEGTSIAGYRELLRAVTRGHVPRTVLRDRAERVRALRRGLR